MAVWSSFVLTKNLFRATGVLTKILPKNVSVTTPSRCMSEQRTFVIQPSRWQWHKTKDWLHFYVLLAAIPLGVIIFTANVFIGPATLTEIPEGYEPKPWEYYKSPITRFFVKYITPDPQAEYEKFMHHIFQEDEVRRIRDLEDRVKESIMKEQDYKAFYYRNLFQKEYIHQYRDRVDRDDL